jgi:hypothetical protein
MLIGIYGYPLSFQFQTVTFWNFFPETTVEEVLGELAPKVISKKAGDKAMFALLKIDRDWFSRKSPMTIDKLTRRPFFEPRFSTSSMWKSRRP